MSHIIDCMNFPDTIKKGNIEEHPEEVKELSVHGRLTIIGSHGSRGPHEVGFKTISKMQQSLYRLPPHGAALVLM